MACGFVRFARGDNGATAQRPTCAVARPGDLTAQCFFDQDPSLREWRHCSNWWREWYWRARRSNVQYRIRLKRRGVRIKQERVTWPVPNRAEEV